MSKVFIKNIGKLVSGDLEKGVLNANAVYIQDRKIVKIGMEGEIRPNKVDIEVDIGGMILTPGLIDPHVHPSIGDWTPRQRTLGWIESYLNGGVTTMISQGEVHVQGRPHDAAGTKALAILAKKTFDNYRPDGMKTHCGALILEKGLTEKDFKEMADEGVWLIAEIGGSGLYKMEDVLPMVKLARKYAMKVSMHFGGPSIPGSAGLFAEDIIKVKPDIAVHCNGGTTAPPFEDIKRVVKETNIIIEVIHNGNPNIMFKIVELLKEGKELNRLIIGSDSPVGTGVIPLAILRVILQISSLNNLPAEKVIALATGNTAKVYGLNTGKIEEGREADLLAMDCPIDSVGKNALEAIEVGDMPAVTLIMVDGKIVSLRGRNTPMAARTIKINGVVPSQVSIEKHLYGG